MTVGFLLFDGFETLDAFGPAEMLGRVEEWRCRYVSLRGGPITSSQNVTVLTEPVSGCPCPEILVIPGGQGTRVLVNEPDFIAALAAWAERSRFCFAVCTGSALLARTGLLDTRRATSNKRSFEWVVSVRPQVRWQQTARWVVDGKYYTSSGISAGTDMALGFIADRLGTERAEAIAARTEYRWHSDPDDDPFSLAVPCREC